ncbi:MAG: DM13 domain-containing protein [Patescibacteria group bacterium]
MVKKLLIILVIIAVIGIGYYLISPLFINIKANEAVPVSNTKDIPKEVEIKSAQIVGTGGHEASGSIRIVSDGTDTYVRYENFKTINGPDIYVYLSKDLDAKEYISLGKVKATEGNINYKIPTSANIKDYKYVMVWCKAFGVLFNYADISSL